MAEREPNNYKIRCTLHAHTSDVRAIAASGNEVATASRDKTAILWIQSKSHGKIFEPAVVYEGHTGYVTSIILINDSTSHPEGLTVTGSRDSTIFVFPRRSSAPIHTLTDHSDNVSALAWGNGILLSGSWDHTIRVWTDWQCKMELKGHSGPIWSVKMIFDGNYNDPLLLTASADKTIKSWKNGKEVVTFSGHKDCVRGLTVKDSSHFYSCSNDATIMLWATSGECISTFFGHSSFIYSISVIGTSGNLVTGSEDRTVRVWNSFGENTETIYMPAQSVWAVTALSNGDIAVGLSDNTGRIFSIALDRQADEAALTEFDDAVGKLKISVQDVGGIKASEFPDKSVLLAPGKRDGQSIMVKDGGKIMCHNWSASKQKWELVGEVVGGAGGSASTSGKVLHQGKEYDFVFDVDLDENRMIKLPYNKGEDPWAVAQQFIHTHKLPQDYLSQVADFIVKNSNCSSSFQATGYEDPFTGGSRYIPSGTSSESNMGQDPLTGAGRYVPGAPQSSSSNVSSQFFPQLTPLRFENMNKAGLLSKLQESNTLVSTTLSKNEMSQLVEQVCSSVTQPELLSPLETALQWPVERVWPALDVLRLALRFEPVQKTWVAGDKGEAILGLLVGFLKPPLSTNTQLLSLRCLANFACHSPGKQLLAKSRNIVITPAIEMCPYPNKNIEIAASTLILNYSIIFSSAGTVEDRCEILSAVSTLALSLTDREALFRNLVSLGTLLCKGGEVASLAKSLDLKPILQNCAALEDPPKLSECAKHVMKLL